MTALLLALCLGVAFDAQDLPGLQLTGYPIAGATPFRGYVQTDLDGDGALDLILTDEVLFQRDGRFPPEARAMPPAFSDQARMDADDGLLYYLFADRLLAVAWEDGEWRAVLDQPLDPPRPYRLERPHPEQAHVFQEPFLGDMTGDGVPEVIVVGEDGVHVFRRDGDAPYARAAVFGVFPPTRAAPVLAPKLWPRAERGVAYPERAMWTRVLVAGSRIETHTSEPATGGRQSWRIARHEVLWNLPEGPVLGEPEVMVFPAAPRDARVVRLGNDGQVGLSSRDWRVSETTPFPMPVREFQVWTDPKAPPAAYRFPSLQAGKRFVDFNGNGLQDLVVESTGLFDDGAREAAHRFLNRRAIDHTVRVYLQGPNGLAETPRVVKNVVIALDRPPARDSAFFRRYARGELLSLDGDFNGDGYRDLAVQHAPDEIAIYLAEGYRYPRRPSATLTVPPDKDFIVADINGNGRSDIVLQWEAPGPNGENSQRARVYFSVEAKP